MRKKVTSISSFFDFCSRNLFYKGFSIDMKINSNVLSFYWILCCSTISPLIRQRSCFGRHNWHQIPTTATNTFHPAALKLKYKRKCYSLHSNQLRYFIIKYLNNKKKALNSLAQKDICNICIFGNIWWINILSLRREIAPPLN